MLDLQKAQEWVVTTKLGSSDKRPGTSAAPPRDCRFYAGEMAMSTFVLTAAFYGIFSINRWSFSIFLTLQGAPRRCPAVTEPMPGTHPQSLLLGQLPAVAQLPAQLLVAVVLPQPQLWSVTHAELLGT